MDNLTEHKKLAEEISAGVVDIQTWMEHSIRNLGYASMLEFAQNRMLMWASVAKELEAEESAGATVQ